jgi:serine/threonine protein kinase
MSKLVGHVIAGRYRVDEFLGRGGMAEVYKVWDQQRATWLAMKVLHESLAEDKVFLRRFRREATNLAKLRHPNIVRFYEWGEADELVFMLMEYVSGVTLSKAIKRNSKPFSPSQVLGIIQPVCSALHYAHERGLAHCDIKPSNIMLDESGRVFLTDFGIARVTEGSATATLVGAGTPAYMSPEQVNGADPTPQTDIYAIGVVLFELLTGGERPFTGERASITGTVGEKIRWEKRKLSPPSPRQYNPEIAPAIEAVVMRCLSKDRRVRYSSVTTLLDDLVQSIGDNTEALPPSVFVDKSVKIEKPTPKKRINLVSGLTGLAFILLLVLGVAGATILNLQKRADKQPTLSRPSPVVVTKVVERVVEVEVTSTQPTKRPTDPPKPTKRPPTNTPRPTTKPVKSLSVNIVNEQSARYIHVTGGLDDYDEIYGPVANGELVLGSNDVFCIYVDILGNVYILRYGTTLRVIENIKPKLAALRRGDEPNYDLRLTTDDNGTYTLYINEKNYGDNYSIKLPRNLTLD